MQVNVYTIAPEWMSVASKLLDILHEEFPNAKVTLHGNFVLYTYALPRENNIPVDHSDALETACKCFFAGYTSK